MKLKIYTGIFFTLLTSLLLCACQAKPTTETIDLSSEAVVVSTVVETESTAIPTIKEIAVTESPSQATPEPEAEPTQEDEVVQVARAYFMAISEGNSETAANLLSSFSLMVFQITRGEATEALQEQMISGVEWSNLEILDTQQFDEQTILVHVTYTQKVTSTADATETPVPTVSSTQTPSQTSDVETIDALWPMRLESSEWRYNWNNVIDFRTLDQESQTVNGVTILPLQIIRFSDKIQLIALVQNRTSETVVLGQTNETLGTFYFNDQTVIAEKTQWILNPLRSVPEAVLEIKGLYTSYPDKVEIRKWNSYQVDPWFTFILE